MFLKQQQEQRAFCPICMPGVEDKEVTKQLPLEKDAEEGEPILVKQVVKEMFQEKVSMMTEHK